MDLQIILKALILVFVVVLSDFRLGPHITLLLEQVRTGCDRKNQ